jgi:NADP-dependent aldehyde dehydrogenase
MALYKMAQERDEPIPVFSEMGSVNPIVILPKTMAAQTDTLAKTLASSVTLGAGQFCTNPGLVFVVKSPELAQFEANYAQEISKVTSATMLTEGIRINFFKLRDEALEQAGVESLAMSDVATEDRNQSQASIARVSGQAFISNPKLHEEVFGPFSLLVVSETVAEMQEAVSKLSGQLTTSLMADAEEAKEYPQLVRILARRAGRFIMNGAPTGVEVCASMHHGGPFPSTTDSRFTSVGRHAILRFVRPQSFQDWPQSMLPDELKDSNPLNVWRLVDNEWTQSAV